MIHLHQHKPRIVWLSMRGEPIFPGKVTLCQVCGALRMPSGKALRSGSVWGPPIEAIPGPGRYPEGAGLHLTGEPSSGCD